MIVKLNPREIAAATAVGEMRNAESREAGYVGQFNDIPDVEYDVKGAVGEIAVAKVLGVYWTGLERQAKADVGIYHVRYSSDPTGPLYVRPREDPEADWRYVLTTGPFDAGGGEIEVVGGQTAGYAMKRELCDPGNRGRPTWRVDQKELHRLEVKRRGDGVFKTVRR